MEKDKPAKSLRKILIVKIGAIGDVVMASTVIEAAREGNPNVELSWLCGRGVEKLVRSFSGISEVIAIDENNLISGFIWQRLMELIKIWRAVFFKKYDLVVTGHTDWRYLLLSFPVLAKERRSFRGRGLVRGRWHASEYARLIHNQDGPFAQSPVMAPFKKESEEIRINIPNDCQSILFFPGGAKNMLRDDAIRRWPIEYYRELAEKFIKRNFSIILSGGYNDYWVRESFIGLKYIDMIGKVDLPQIIELCQKCTLVITHDSGPMHLAYASGVKTLALFGPTNPYEKVPNCHNVKVVWGGANLPCRPCYDGRGYSICSSNNCLKNLSVELVYEEALKML